LILDLVISALGVFSVLVWSNLRRFYPPPERLPAWIPRFVITMSFVSLGCLAYTTWRIP
jgi:hypothetical protein